MTAAAPETIDGVPGPATVDVAPGTRMLVVSDLHLGSRPTDSSLAVAAELAAALDAWVGPGVVVLAGDAFDLVHDPQRDPGRILDAHPRLATAMSRFREGSGRRLVVLAGNTDCPLAWQDKAAAGLRTRYGADVALAAELRVATGAGERVVRIEHGSRFGDGEVPRDADTAPIESSQRAYRRLARVLGWLVAPLAAALVLLAAFLAVDALHPLWAHRLLGWSGRLAVGSAAVAIAAVLAVVVLRVFRASPDDLAAVRRGGNDGARAHAEELIGDGYAGLITGHSHEPELSALGAGFYANCGSGGSVVRPRPAWLGLPPVFVRERQVSWVELEAGADLHVRLLDAHVDEPGTTLVERLAARPGPDPVLKPAVVAMFPGGTDWPPPSYGALGRRRTRRIAGAIIALAGLLDLTSAITPPLHGRLDTLRDLVPMGVPQTASALVAAAGLGLLLLSRGVRRGQRHAWMLAVALTAVSAVLHVVKGLDVEEAAAAILVLSYLLAKRRAFTAAADRPSISRAAITLAAGATLAVVVGTITVLRFGEVPGMSTGRAISAVAERLVGIEDIAIPGARGRFLSATLAGIGVALAVAAAWLVFRPVVARTKPSPETAHARDLVHRYGGDTLSYFALRDDKQHWFWKDTLVAYAVHNGVCLVSPDPIGPVSQRAGAWRAFREFADGHGWAVAVMAAGEGWLPIYRSTGMHDVYVGDEAIVDVRRFNLEGGRMKGLRQAVNRIAKYGYTIEFHDPAHLDPALESELRRLMTESRRGDVERGFSMTLGRVFAPQDEGLLLAVCFAPSGEAAAFCQFVPASDIDGYSLDLMRRSEADEHWNGLTDFVVVRSIEHLRELGMRGLGLNFAVMRSVLAHEGGDKLGHRIERKMLGWLSDSMQIESLWKYNAKFDPDWHPRYAVYDAPENFLTSAFAVAKAESFWELPLIGRFLAPEHGRVTS